MTLVKDTMDVWLEAAYEYVRDQLRANTVVGVGRDAGARQIEVGEITFGELSEHPENLPCIWITPGNILPRETGNVIEHTVRLEFHAFSSIQLETLGRRADSQKTHRQFYEKVWNEALNLRDIGITAGHWDDWRPNGEIEPISIPVSENTALMGAILRFQFVRDRIWISEGA